MQLSDTTARDPDHVRSNPVGAAIDHVPAQTWMDIFHDPNHSGTAGTQITTHAVEGAGSGLEIRVGDEPGAGGGNHRYDITGFNSANNPSADFHHMQKLVVLFQNGVLPDVGVNGITIEALLAVCAHRLQGFQNGPFACASNQTALDCIRAALFALHSRTRDRLARQVEGKHEK